MSESAQNKPENGNYHSTHASPAQNRSGLARTTRRLAMVCRELSSVIQSKELRSLKQRLFLFVGKNPKENNSGRAT